MKQKIRMDVDELRVQSYATTSPENARGGTVHGREELVEEVTGTSGCSATDGVVACKSCGPCCV
jgi:hypothetical protein